MNEDDILALDQILGHDNSCWLATLPVPHRHGESNLFARDPVLFRKKTILRKMMRVVIQGSNRGAYKYQRLSRLLLINGRI
jgi:hypothetical protein